MPKIFEDTKLSRNLIKFIRKFFAGFISVIPFTKTKLNGYTFSRPVTALDQDWLDIGNDIEIAKQNFKK
ncbi:MAG: hypothetical protein SFV53_06900 [Rickettsiales bacterium]|nr:hypothetical protein [Rickettsiales bacterium]